MPTDWIPELADDDLDTLIEALEAWEHKDAAGDIMTTLIGSMLTRKHGDEMGAMVAAERAKEAESAETKKRLRKERSVILRAKLLMLRDRRQAQHMSDSVLRS